MTKCMQTSTFFTSLQQTWPFPQLLHKQLKPFSPTPWLWLPFQKPFLPFAQLLLPFPKLSFPSHWQGGEHSKAQTSSLEPNVQFHSHENRLGYQPKQRNNTQDQPYNGYNSRNSSQNCTNSNLFSKHNSNDCTYAHMNPRNYHLTKTYQQNMIPGKYKFRLSHSKFALEQNLKP